MRLMIVMLLIVTTILTGCWDQKVFEKTGYILQMGIESGKTAELLITYTSPVVGGEIKEQVEIINIQGDILREARENARLLSPKLLEGGKIQQLLISNKMAEKGINELLDLFHRDPALPTLALIVVIEGSPYEMLKRATTFEDKPRAAFYINELLKSNIISSYIPETRIWNFSALSLAPGIDPITPILKLQGEGIKVTGSALFSQDKMVGKLSPRETSLLLAMMGKLKPTEYVGNILPTEDKAAGEKARTAVLIRTAKSKLNVSFSDDEPIVSIAMKIDCILDEFQLNSISDADDQKVLEQQLSTEIKNKCVKILDYLKSTGSDPLGIGNIVRAKYNDYWQQVDWKEAYKEVEMDVSVRLDIKQFGTIY
ncbi:MAG TPA: Ger(x)C family spore germination protein [Clostridia bacterium]|nr:Ger(x)C family spore germination protein [Clostridia bacterium]